jgi:hypothetical protein
METSVVESFPFAHSVHGALPISSLPHLLQVEPFCWKPKAVSVPFGFRGLVVASGSLQVYCTVVSTSASVLRTLRQYIDGCQCTVVSTSASVLRTLRQYIDGCQVS